MYVSASVFHLHGGVSYVTVAASPNTDAFDEVWLALNRSDPSHFDVIANSGQPGDLIVLDHAHLGGTRYAVVEVIGFTRYALMRTAARHLQRHTKIIDGIRIYRGPR